MSGSGVTQRTVSVRGVAQAMAVIGILCIALHWYPESWPASDLVAALYVNVATSLLSIALTVLLIDRLYEHRDAIQQKKRLVWEMGSSDQALAGRAVKELRDAGWLNDGSLQDADLVQANLEGVDLSGVQLQRAKLSRCNLKRTNLSGAALDEANLDECVAEGANLKAASLTGASLRRAKLSAAVLDDADLTGDIDFLRAQLVRTSLRNAKLSGARFEECDLTECDLSNADLAGATLQGTSTERASLEGANLERADLTGLLKWDSIKTITGAKVAGIKGEPAGFREWAIRNGAVE
jgi:uncharacterized protein YjbI with pentapeptide repeats